MAINIKRQKTERLVRELARQTGLSLAEAVRQAATEKLRRMEADYAEQVARLTPER